MHARQMGGKGATVGAALLGALARRRRVPLVVGRFGGRNRLLDILKRQRELVRIELLRALAKLHAPEMLQAVILCQRMVALGNRRIPLHQRRRQPRLQHCDIGWKLICVLAHAQHASRFAGNRGAQSAA